METSNLESLKEIFEIIAEGIPVLHRVSIPRVSRGNKNDQISTKNALQNRETFTLDMKQQFNWKSTYTNIIDQIYMR